MVDTLSHTNPRSIKTTLVVAPVAAAVFPLTRRARALEKLLEDELAVLPAVVTPVRVRPYVGGDLCAFVVEVVGKEISKSRIRARKPYSSVISSSNRSRRTVERS